MKKIHISLWISTLQLFDIAFKPLNYDYNKLTQIQKNKISLGDFNDLVYQIKEYNKEIENGVVYK